MKNESGSSRMDTVLKMLLIAFVSLLAFSSGVYFGKQLSDSDYQLKALESDFNHGGVAKGGDDGHGDENAADAINQEEVAALSDKLVNSEKSDMDDEHDGKDESRKVASTHDSHAAAPAHGHDAHAAPTKAPAAAKATPDKHADMHGAKHGDAHASKHGSAPAKIAAKPEVKPDAKPDLTAASKAAMRVAQNAAPSEPEKPAPVSRVPNSLPKTVGSSQDVEFTVQVASYPTSEAARDHANELVKKGFPAFPVEANVNGKVWYRVSVGSFKTQKDAITYRAQLLKQTAMPSAVIQKIQR